jgi:hypothetical protein
MCLPPDVPRSLRTVFRALLTSRRQSRKAPRPAEAANAVARRAATVARRAATVASAFRTLSQVTTTTDKPTPSSSPSSSFAPCLLAISPVSYCERSVDVCRIHSPSHALCFTNSLVLPPHGVLCKQSLQGRPPLNGAGAEAPRRGRSERSGGAKTQRRH